MIQENDQIREEKLAALAELAQEYLDVLRCQANTPACLDTIRRVEAMLNWATSSKPGGDMSQEVQGQFVDLSCALAKTYGTVTRALSNDEVLAELTARGSSRQELMDLLVAIERVGGAFYNPAQPA
jgi:hypothetical protein